MTISCLQLQTMQKKNGSFNPANILSTQSLMHTFPLLPIASALYCITPTVVAPKSMICPLRGRTCV